MRPNYEDAPEYTADAYTVDGYRGIAWYVLGWETEPDEDTEWTGIEERTGKLVCRMVGDDRYYRFEPEEVEPLERSAYCAVCGQVGCHHDGYEEDEDDA